MPRQPGTRGGGRPTHQATHQTAHNARHQATRKASHQNTAPAPRIADTAGPCLVLKPGREKSLLLRHPWIFSGAIDRIEGSPASGTTVGIAAHDGALLAVAAYSPASQITARVWTFDPGTSIDDAFFTNRIERAVRARAPMLDAQHTGTRLIHGESDGLPGVIADQYHDAIVMQLLSSGAEYWRDTIVGVLAQCTGAKFIYERSDAEVRALEGLTARTGPLHGTAPEQVVIIEGGLNYVVDVVTGQKTGFYLDQRDSRRRVREHARGRRVLNAFSYTGGFTLAALAGAATDVLSIDSSKGALALARTNLARNPTLDSTRATWRDADVFTALRDLRNENAHFDLIVLDPPKFAPTAAHAQRAARAYKDINLLALKLLAPGGLLFTFSCSGGISAELFQKIVAGAALDAQADVQIIERLGPAADHPVALNFPEGDYLKGLLLRKA